MILLHLFYFSQNWKWNKDKGCDLGSKVILQDSIEKEFSNGHTTEEDDNDIGRTLWSERDSWILKAQTSMKLKVQNALACTIPANIKASLHH